MKIKSHFKVSNTVHYLGSIYSKTNDEYSKCLYYCNNCKHSILFRTNELNKICSHCGTMQYKKDMVNVEDKSRETRIKNYFAKRLRENNINKNIIDKNIIDK